MKKRRLNASDASISFLDVICCGFGAIVLLLVIVRSSPIPLLESAPEQGVGQIRALQEELFELRGEIARYERELTTKQEENARLFGRANTLETQVAQTKSEIMQLQSATTSQESRVGELRVALQSLTDEMKRLLGNNVEVKNQLIAGIPVDSEYLIFIVDTSGSMFNFAWPRVMQEMINVLDIYPQVKGMQIMNDMGEYMFSTFRGQWIPDSPARREIIINQLRNWSPFSNSSPVEGITAAIRSFYTPEHKMSLYVFGDDFTGRSIELVLDTVALLNRRGSDNQPMVRIHTVGFPVQFSRPTNEQSSGVRFAALMRDLAEENNGTFVGLNDFRVK